MNLATEPYIAQHGRWPTSGSHILAHFDEHTIVVYQAFYPATGAYALKHGRFGDGFSYRRMSWIKPNFLWMMYRSNWGQSQGQQTVLGIRLPRRFLETLLVQAVASSFSASSFTSQEEWQAAVAGSDVRLQWDPDHLPPGEKCERRVIQLGMRGEILAAYGDREIVEIIDMTDFVAQQSKYASTWRNGILQTPSEHVYWPADPNVRPASQHVNSFSGISTNSPLLGATADQPACVGLGGTGALSEPRTDRVNVNAGAQKMDSSCVPAMS